MRRLVFTISGLLQGVLGDSGSTTSAGSDRVNTEDPGVTLTRLLSEVIDVVQEVKQAHRKVRETHALHAVLDKLFDNLRSWAQLLMEEDRELGVSPLGSTPSVAGRKLPNLWPGEPSDEDVRLLVQEHLDRLERHIAQALAGLKDDQPREVLAKVEQELLVDAQALREL